MKDLINSLGIRQEDLPNFIYCSITGARLAVRRDVLWVRLKEAGSWDRLVKTYVGRAARKLVKKKMPVDEIRKILGCDEEHANMNLTDSHAHGSSSIARTRVQNGDAIIDPFWRKPEYKITGIFPRMNVPDATKDTCHRPDIYLDSYCDECPLFAECSFDNKHLPKRKAG